MSQSSAYEQYMLELVNRERAKVGAQPLASDGDLNEAAERHSQWMIATDTFSHTGAGSSNAGQRMSAAGYTFNGSWTWGENISWASTRAPSGLQDEVSLLHTNLMNSPDHRANILNGNFRELGIGFEVGDFKGYDAAMVTQNFAKTCTNAFLTGVAFDDKDGDWFYDLGEGLGGLVVKITTTSGALIGSTTTMEAGGYDITLAAGTYRVTFSGDSIATTTQQVTIGSSNVKVDLVDPAPASTTPAPGTIVGTAAGETLYGTSSPDKIQGFGGNDRLYGNAENDTLEGGVGNDRLFGNSGRDTLLGGDGNDFLSGGSGNDVLTGGAHADGFVFNTALNGATNVDQITDLAVVDDTVWLSDAIFRGLTTTGTLSASAYRTGFTAQDANDRIIYKETTGALIYDADGTGSGAAVKFAEVAAGLALTSADFSVF